MLSRYEQSVMEDFILSHARLIPCELAVLSGVVIAFTAPFLILCTTFAVGMLSLLRSERAFHNCSCSFHMLCCASVLSFCAKLLCSIASTTRAAAGSVTSTEKMLVENSCRREQHQQNAKMAANGED